MHAAHEIARVTGEVAMGHFRRHLRTHLAVETKSDGSPVTIADRDAERVARDWISARFPSDGVIGEELGALRPDAPRRWYIDPIDGTKTFVRGVPLWGSLVAVVEEDIVIAGAAAFPATDETLAAAIGEGCWWNAERCRVSGVASLAESTVLTTDERFPRDAGQLARWDELARAAGVSRSWGDCYGYLLVATGRAELMADGVLNAWDAACFLPIIEEAGGVFTDWRGERTAFGGSAIATNESIARVAREILVSQTQDMTT
ncbi:MAG: inositol monophosphatase family protein [Gemmatimonadaceae bacterium]